MTIEDDSDWDVVFHIGTHRTGTTFLQRVVFPRYRDAICLATPTENAHIARFLLEAPTASLSPSAFADLLPAAAPRRKLLVSHESLSGSLVADDLEMAERLYRVAPAARVILSIRSQFTALPSLFPIYIKSGGRKSYHRYLEQALDPGKFDYLALFERYRQLFGSGSMLVLLFEQLRDRPQEYLGALGAFIGLSGLPRAAAVLEHRNPRYPKLAVRTTRLMNLVLPEAVLAGLLGPRLSGRMRGSFMKQMWKISDLLSSRKPRSSRDDPDRDELARRLITQRHGPSNERLSRLLNLSLEAEGYPVLFPPLSEGPP